MFEEAYQKLEKALLTYTNNYIIPSVKKHMYIEGFNATGDYSKQLKASIAKRLRAIIGVQLESTTYGQFVEGDRSGFDAEGYYCSKIGIDRIARWSVIKGLGFKRRKKDGSFSGKLLTPKQTAFVIVKKWKLEGKKRRFFIDHIIGQHMERLQKELSTEAMNYVLSSKD